MYTRPTSLILCSILVLASFSCDEREPDKALEGRRISRLEMRYMSVRTVDEDRLRNHISSKPGLEYSLGAIDSDVKSLYESGLVEDVRFIAKSDGNLVCLIVEILTPRPCGPPFCIGNTSFSDMQLSKKSGLTELRQVTIDSLEVASREIERFYVDHGYTEVVVSFRAFDGGKARPDDYIFVVVEGLKVGQPIRQTNKAQQDVEVQ